MRSSTTSVMLFECGQNFLCTSVPLMYILRTHHRQKYLSTSFRLCHRLQPWRRPPCLPIILNVSVSLLALSLQLLSRVLFFSRTSIPSSSTLWEISFHFPLDFELFHWSFELCPTFSAADDRQWDLDLQSFDDHPACLWIMARLSAAMFFLTFDTGFSSWRK